MQCATDYIASVVEEAALRERGEVVDMQSYENLRRNNSAVPTCFALIPYCLHIDLPDEVVEDPIFNRINLAGIDMVCWSNVSSAHFDSVTSMVEPEHGPSTGPLLLQHGASQGP